MHTHASKGLWPNHTTLAVLALVAAFACAAPAAADTGESQRLARAKDHIAEEQWTRAIAELRAVVADPKERGRDEALYWLAHSLNEAGDQAAAIATISRLEREYPSSLWVKPAGALRIQMAVRVGRIDVLWWTAVAPAPPAPPPAPARASGAPPPPPPPVRATPATPAPPARVHTPRPPAIWVSESFHPDPDLRVQALGYLIRTDAEKVIPILKDIALEPAHPGAASRAVFLLAQSDRPEAQETIMHVVRVGVEPVRVAAIRELGRFGGPDVPGKLLEFYTAASPGELALKRQIVNSLGERSEQRALLTIVQSEKNLELRQRAIVTLGQAGGTEQLWALYNRAAAEMKRPIIVGLFNARAEEQLIRIAERERNAALRRVVLEHLGLLGTPGAKEYLQKVSRNR
ncbi:MAG TPA: tetratricopeptide repeat protein [Vicinamibacterales bacterium]|nr:tetratricopeptide repeat protein [Vicinamibacterales bacterium]